MQRRTLLGGGFATLGLATLPWALAHEGHGTPAASGIPNRTRVKLADVELIDHQRRRGRLARDFVGSRIVVASFIFTTCSSICPIVSAIFADVQKELPPALAADATLLSISIDPLNDTPDRLAEQAKQYGSGAAWRWLTGRPELVEAALKGFGAWTGRPDDHPPMAIVGDPLRDTWLRFNGTPTAREIVAVVRDLHARRGTAKGRT